MRSVICDIPKGDASEQMAKRTVSSSVSGRRRTRCPEHLIPLLPDRIAEAIRLEEDAGTYRHLEEIRLRRETVSSLTTDCGTVLLPVVLSGKEMDETLLRISGGSLYAHSETIGEGYLVLPYGVRVGICGRAAVEDGRVIGVYDPSALSFRIPCDPLISEKTVLSPLLRLVEDGLADGRGILLYAPPGEGKTTLLRALVRRLSMDGKLRTAVVDTRGELALSGLCAPSLRGRYAYTVDILSGYPRPKGIEIAVRTMNAQLCVCDEVGDVEEAHAVLAVENCGVPLLATAHGRDIGGLLRRPGIRMMHEGRIFSHYIGISRAGSEFTLSVTEWGEANALL